MAIFCLATSEEDLRRRIDNILLGITLEGEPFTVKDMNAGGAIVALLHDAIHPNLVQTTKIRQLLFMVVHLLISLMDVTLYLLPN